MGDLQEIAVSQLEREDYSLLEIARILGIGKRAVRSKVSSGKLEVVRRDSEGCQYISKSSLISYIKGSGVFTDV